jgi:hypothetical protein
VADRNSAVILFIIPSSIEHKPLTKLKMVTKSLKKQFSQRLHDDHIYISLSGRRWSDGFIPQACQVLVFFVTQSFVEEWQTEIPQSPFSSFRRPSSTNLLQR